jgi:hypothetical protein
MLLRASRAKPCAEHCDDVRLGISAIAVGLATG